MEGYDTEAETGVIKRMVNTLFDYIGNSPDYLEFKIKVSVVELYLEKLKDLIGQKNDLKIREDK
jgi:kinesin family protein 5